ncbi:MAG: N-acetylmuramoyl-L-alanine amidase [bacterium]
MTTFNIIKNPSPNYGQRQQAIDMIVLHYTGMESGPAALQRLCDREAGVSAHYLVEEDGRIYALVAEQERAFHAGISYWQGQDDVNQCSIGIEIVHPGHEFGYRSFAQEQITAVNDLVGDIRARLDIPVNRIVGHSDVAPERKEDPGELFPWDKLALSQNAIGTSPQDYHAAERPDYERCLYLLKQIGYRVEGQFHSAPVLAFQRRFCPDALGKGLDPRTRNALVWAANAMRF